MKKVIKVIIISLFWILIWYIFSILIDLPLLFPTPWDVIKRIGELAITGRFYLIILSSLGRILLGIFIAIILSLIMALLCTLFKTVYEFFIPLVSIMKSTPIVAFVYLVNLFLHNESTVVLICFLMVFPIVFTNIYQGIKSIDTDLIEMCKIYNIPLKKQLISIYIPSVIPYFLSSLISSIGLAWKAGVAAEVLCTPNISIGIEIFYANSNLELIDLFAWTVFGIVLCILFESGTKKIFKSILKKKQLDLEI